MRTHSLTGSPGDHSIAELLSALRNCGVCQDSARGGLSPELFSSHLHESKLLTTLFLLTLILPLRKEEEDGSLGLSLNRRGQP